VKRLFVCVLCCALCAAMLDCGKKKEGEPAGRGAAASGTIVDVLDGDGRFSTLVASIDSAGLAETLAGKGPFTLFAPPDSVFAKLPPGTAESLLQDPPVLKNILLYHIVPGRLTAADLAVLPAAATLLGAPLPIARAAGGALTVGGAGVVATDIEAKNGIIQIIDKVLIPPEKSPE
jgi:transforming growth factor-beta-induced protein